MMSITIRQSVSPNHTIAHANAADRLRIIWTPETVRMTANVSLSVFGKLESRKSEPY